MKQLAIEYIPKNYAGFTSYEITTIALRLLEILNKESNIDIHRNIKNGRREEKKYTENVFENTTEAINLYLNNHYKLTIFINERS